MRRRAEPCGVLVSGVAKALAGTAALRGVDLEIRPGELVALLGPSGSGKTTLLRVIAGLERPDAGEVYFAGEPVGALPPARRGVGFVFQSYALFRHMSVARNVSFGLDVRPRAVRPRRSEREAKVADLLRLVGLEGYGERNESNLSGGQKQRVALARALAVEPRILLLDEPFGALDAVVRKTLRRELRRIHEATGVTTLFVTHDQEEAVELADRIAVLNAGRIEQTGVPDELLNRPTTAFVAGFIGDANAIPGQTRAGVFFRDGPLAPAGGIPDGPAIAFVRPHELVMADSDAEGFEARLVRISQRATGLHVEAALGDGRIIEMSARSGGAPQAAPGEVIRLTIAAARIFPQAELS